MKRTLLTLMAAGVGGLGGFLVAQRELNERAKPRPIKETFWSKLRELWAIVRRCQTDSSLDNRRIGFCDEMNFLAERSKFRKIRWRKDARLDQLRRTPNSDRGHRCPNLARWFIFAASPVAIRYYGSKDWTGPTPLLES